MTEVAPSAVESLEPGELAAEGPAVVVLAVAVLAKPADDVVGVQLLAAWQAEPVDFWQLRQHFETSVGFFD